MAKDKEKKLAFEYYVKKGYTQKATADKVGVTTKTMCDWVDKGNWKELREAEATRPGNLEGNFREILAGLTEDLLRLQTYNSGDPNAAIQKMALTDQISKVNKALDAFRKENTPSLSIYVECMEMFMNDLQNENPELFYKLIDFQEEHLRKMAHKLG